MAVYRTTDTELTSIADAIRAKTGGSSSLIYPTGFVSAINSISTSGGGGASSNNLILKDANGDTTSTSAISSDIILGETSVTPTSSAQIITPETGLNGYHTINIGATPTYNFMGENPIFVQTLYNEEISLADTDFANWTISTSTGTILASSTLTNNALSLPVQYDYIVRLHGYVKYAYTEAISGHAYATNAYTVGFLSFGQRPNSPDDFIAGTYNTVSYPGSLSNTFMLFYTSTGIYQMTNNAGGVMVQLMSPGFSNQSSTTNFTLTPKTPQIRAAVSNSYMSSYAFNVIDTTNTKIGMKVDLFRCDTRNDFYHTATEEMRAMHQALYPST